LLAQQDDVAVMQSSLPEHRQLVSLVADLMLVCPDQLVRHLVDHQTVLETMACQLLVHPPMQPLFHRYSCHQRTHHPRHHLCLMEMRQVRRRPQQQCRRRRECLPKDQWRSCRLMCSILHPHSPAQVHPRHLCHPPRYSRSQEMAVVGQVLV
jgi:hypothetical protein